MSGWTLSSCNPDFVIAGCIFQFRLRKCGDSAVSALIAKRLKAKKGKRKKKKKKKREKREKREKRSRERGGEKRGERFQERKLCRASLRVTCGQPASWRCQSQVNRYLRCTPAAVRLPVSGFTGISRSIDAIAWECSEKTPQSLMPFESQDSIERLHSDSPPLLCYSATLSSVLCPLYFLAFVRFEL